MTDDTDRTLNSGNSKWKARLELVQRLASVLGLSYLIAASLGGVLLLVYFLRNQFSPGGISAGDTLTLATLLFGFVVVLSIALAFGTVAAFPVARLAHLCLKGAIILWKRASRLWHRSETEVPYWHRYGFASELVWKPATGFWLVVGTAVLLGFAVVIWALPAPAAWFLLTVLTTGAWLSLFVFGDIRRRYSRFPHMRPKHPFDRWMNRQPEWVYKWTAAFAVAAGVQMLSLGLWQDASFTAVGFRANDASVRLAKEDFDEVVEQAAQNGMAVNPCMPIDASSAVIQHMDVLWQNVGTKSLARFPAQEFGAESLSRDIVRIAPERSKLIVVAGRRKISCSEFLSDALFSHDKRMLRAGATARLTRQLQWLQSLDGAARLRVVAHTTPDRVTGPEGNTTATDAELVKKFLQRQFGLAPEQIEASGAGDEFPKRECNSALKTAKMQCERINRRVEVFLVAAD